MILTRDITRDDVDYAIDHALIGEYVPFPFEDEYLQKIWELSQDHSSHDAQKLRDEGHTLIARGNARQNKQQLASE